MLTGPTAWGQPGIDEFQSLPPIRVNPDDNGLPDYAVAEGGPTAAASRTASLPRLHEEVPAKTRFAGVPFQSLLGPDPAGPREEPWRFQLLPEGLIYRSYLAGVREPRFASAWVHERDLGWIWDIALGGRVGIARWGTQDAVSPEGWQLDIEGAGLPRLDLQHDRELVAVDFRFGIPITYGRGRYQTKFAYYHLSSHLGDEFMVLNPTISRINFSRDVLVWGHSFHYTEDLRLYGEVGWAFTAEDGSEPWEFQFGAEYSPARQSGLRGAPFFAINAHLREEVNFGGNLVVQTGWQWRGQAGHLFRAGMEYFTGKSEQFQFFNQHEDKVGMGIWYDF